MLAVRSNPTEYYILVALASAHSKHSGSAGPAAGAAVVIACRHTKGIIKGVKYLDLKRDHPSDPLPVSIIQLGVSAPTEPQRRTRRRRDPQSD